MDPQALRDLQRRVSELERTSVRYRQGVVDDASPLDVILSGGDVVIEAVPALASALPVPDGANVGLLAFGNALLALGAIDAPPAWTAYAPTVTTVTLGTGGTTVARYAKHGRTVIYAGKITLGTGGSFTGSDITISLPFEAAGVDVIGSALGVDTGVYRHHGYCVAAAGGQVLRVRLLPNGTDNSPVTMSATAPFTWGDTDVLDWHLTYEADS